MVNNKKKEKMMTCFSYLRCSSTKQSEEGLTIETQKNATQKYAEIHNLLEKEQTEVKSFVDENVSGSVLIAEREQGSILMKQLKEGDVIIVSKLDRMFRNVRDAINSLDFFKENKISVHIIDLGGDICSNGISSLFFTIASAFATFERERISERIKDVFENKKSKNEWCGGKVKIGYRKVKVNGVYVIKEDKKQEKVIRIIHRMRKEGKSLRLIAETVSKKYGNLLNEGSISYQGVRSVLS